VVAKKGGGGCETPPSRISREGGVCDGVKTPPSRVSREGGVVVAKKRGGLHFEGGREGGGSRKPSVSHFEQGRGCGG